MMIAHIEPLDGTVRVHGVSQGFKGLPVRHSDRPLEKDGKLTGSTVHIIATAWTPTPEELTKLNAGGNVIIEEWAMLPNPMNVSVGDPPS